MVEIHHLVPGQEGCEPCIAEYKGGLQEYVSMPSFFLLNLRCARFFITLSINILYSTLLLVVSKMKSSQSTLCHCTQTRIDIQVFIFSVTNLGSYLDGLIVARLYLGCINRGNQVGTYLGTYLVDRRVPTM